MIAINATTAIFAVGIASLALGIAAHLEIKRQQNNSAHPPSEAMGLVRYLMITTGSAVVIGITAAPFIDPLLYQFFATVSSAVAAVTLVLVVVGAWMLSYFAWERLGRIEPATEGF